MDDGWIDRQKDRYHQAHLSRAINLNWVHCMTNLFPIKSIVGLFDFAVHCQTPTSILTENFISGFELLWTSLEEKKGGINKNCRKMQEIYNQLYGMSWEKNHCT